MLSNPRQPKTRLKGYLARAVMLFVCVAAAIPAARAQEQTVILPTREVTVRQSFDEIQRQTDYKIAFNRENLNLNKKTLVSGSRLSVKDLLTQVLADTGYVFQQRGNQIVLVSGVASQDKTTQKQGGAATSSASASSRDADPSLLHSTMDGMPKNTGSLTVVQDPWGDKAEPVRESGSMGYWVGESDDIGSIDMVMLHFRVGKSLLERDFMNNSRSLETINRTFSDSRMVSRMDYVTITSASSPEGNTVGNDKLAQDRALAVKSHLMWKYPYLDRNRIYTYSVGEDWSGLRKMVEDDPKVPGRGEVLELLSEDIHNDARKSRLKRIDNGRAYEYISKNMLPYLRGAAACMIYFKDDVQQPSVDSVYIDRIVERVDTVYVDRMVEIPVVDPNAGVRSRKQHYLALKTNLLYDAVLLPDLALEFSLGNRWSMEVGGQWSWWKFENKQFFHRIQMGGLEVRKWLGRDKTPLTGHFFGVYGFGGTYDIRMGNQGVLSNGSWSAGITYGYSMPVANRFNMEFSLGIGYFGGEYEKYTYDEGNERYPWKSTHKLNYVGPTKAEISLVWLIGNGTNNKKSDKK